MPKLKLSKKTWIHAAIVFFACIVMALVDGVLQPGYVFKSAIKICVFLAIPLLYGLYTGTPVWRQSMGRCGHRRVLLGAVLLGAAVYAVILGGYFVLRSLIDPQQITAMLQQSAAVNRSNFIYVALYISLCNSLLEEFFFRGFAFRMLLEPLGRTHAYWFSAAAFALYHVAIMKSWFSPLLFAGLIAALLAAGLFLNWLDERGGSILPSWAVHIFANLAINTVGLILFDII